MLSVLHCIYDDINNPWVGGGGAVRVHEIYKHLVDRVRATVITGNYPGAQSEVIDGVRYVRLGAKAPYAWSRLSFSAAANVYLRRAKYDAAVFDFSSYAPIFVPRLRTAITVHHITGRAASERFGAAVGAAVQTLESLMLKRAPRFSATSEAMADQLERLAPVDLVQAGVPDSLFSVPRREQPYLLFFGRMDIVHKGLDTLLSAFRPISAEHPELTLRLAGRGRDHDRIKAKARELGLEHRVQVLGPASDAERDALYAGALAVCVPSRFEGFGIAAAEAIAAGAPVVVSDVPALREVVRGAGMIVPVADAHALSEALNTLVRDASLRQRLSVQARAAAERFRWSTVAEAHYRFLEKVAA